MKVSKKWLDKFFDAPLPDAHTLAEALTFHAFEIDGVERMGEDEVLDVKVTPNRGHDCLSHRGIAKELSAILKIPLAHDPFDAGRTSQSEGKTWPSVPERPSERSSAGVFVTLNTPLCKRYIAAYIKGVQVGPSPKWLKERLEAIGQRSINNVVDATNFVMFNTGQPLHAFDASKLKTEGGKIDIGVRLARDGEEMTTLDQKKYALKSSMLVIASGGDAVGLAGVKGGIPAAITEETTDIVVESANFDAVTTRKTATALGLRTDASARYEQVISPELCRIGIEGMLEFVEHVTKGEVINVVDIYPESQEITPVSVSVEKVNNLIGVELKAEDVAEVFTRLGFAFKQDRGVFAVTAPFERLDIEIPEDLVEEVGRIVGYDQVPATRLPPFPQKPEINKSFYAAEKIREELISHGFSEIYTSVFADKGERVVLNKVDGVRPYLRESLLPGLLEALERNKHNKDLLGLKDIQLFEIGTVWKDGKEQVMMGTISSEKEKPSERMVEPVDATQYDDFPLSAAERYESFSKYPYILRDIAMWVPAGTDENKLRAEIAILAGPLCLNVKLFDRFEKGEKVSLAYHIIFQTFNRTLTDEEVNKVMDKVSATLRAKGFEIR